MGIKKNEANLFLSQEHGSQRVNDILAKQRSKQVMYGTAVD